MKIVIIGSGVAGSVIADQLRGSGHEVLIIEKDSRPGGMCKSYYKSGFTYEYGPHILANHHSNKKVEKYLKNKIEVIKTQMVSASFIDKQITYYPPSTHSAKRLGIYQKVKNELKNLPTMPNMENFETYLKDKVGKTLYQKFFYNFTKKFWNVEPKTISAEWALIRRLGEDVNSKKMFFNNKWCYYPKKDWNELFKQCLKDVQVLYDLDVSYVDLKNSKIFFNNNDSVKFDLCISTMNIDELLGYKLGKLKYTGYRIEPKIINKNKQAIIDNKPISMLYFPDRKTKYCRISNYGTFQQKFSYPYNNKTILTYEYPDNSIRLYPLSDKKNIKLFSKYVAEISKYKNIITFGRLGLYKYLTSDTTIAMSFRLLGVLNKWKRFNKNQRIEAYKLIRGSWNN